MLKYVFFSYIGPPFLFCNHIIAHGFDLFYSKTQFKSYDFPTAMLLNLKCTKKSFDKLFLWKKE